MGQQFVDKVLRSRLSWLVRLAVAGLVAAGLSYVPYRLVGGAADAKLAEMQTELARVNADIAAGEDDVAARLILVDSLKKDPRTIEDVARDELHMVYPHEIMLRLSPVVKETP